MSEEQPVLKGDLAQRQRDAEADRSAKGLPFYRCRLCQGVISVWDLREIHACPKCAGVRMSPTNLSLREKLLQIWKHPKIWRWKDVHF